jgi:hypothetical protein
LADTGYDAEYKHKRVFITSDLWSPFRISPTCSPCRYRSPFGQLHSTTMRTVSVRASWLLLSKPINRPGVAVTNIHFFCYCTTTPFVLWSAPRTLIYNLIGFFGVSDAKLVATILSSFNLTSTRWKQHYTIYLRPWWRY